MISRVSQSMTSMSNPQLNLRLKSMAMFDFLKLFLTLLVILDRVYHSAEILGYGCTMMPLLDIH
jgi:hypothetical protein